jgi:hypothetical protein
MWSGHDSKRMSLEHKSAELLLDLTFTLDGVLTPLSWGQFNLINNLQSYLFRIYFNIILSYTARSRDTAVGIATVHGLDGREVGVWVPVGERFFSSRCQDRFWGPLSLLHNGHWGLFLGG